MPDYRIEREVVIHAPIEIVWRTITQPDQIRQWFADRVELDLQPGGHGVLVFEDRRAPLVVEAVEPPTRFAFRWNHPAGGVPSAGNSVLVEFTLVGDGEATRLRVIESGLELLDWNDADKARYAEEHRGGWAIFGDRLARLLVERPRE